MLSVPYPAQVISFAGAREEIDHKACWFEAVFTCRVQPLGYGLSAGSPCVPQFRAKDNKWPESQDENVIVH